MRRKLPKAGTLRIRSRFLWWPLAIGDESHWLERARWEEEMVIGSGRRFWYPVRWLDEEKARNMVQVHPGRADEDRAVDEAIERMNKARRGK